ncbi:MAG: hypothetical protein ACREAE_03880 [Nitrosopumilaceae archaeon]
MSAVEHGLVLDELCHSILELNKNIQSVTVVNKYGRAVEKKIREGAQEISREKSLMLFMQHALEISMGKDFDDEYGMINYTFKERENLSMFSFPVNNSVILVTSKTDISPISLAKKIIDAINYYRKPMNDYLLNK